LLALPIWLGGVIGLSGLLFLCCCFWAVSKLNVKESDMDDENKRAVIANDNDIKRQVPGITTQKEKMEQPSELKNQELFYRSINR
jgi:hypothetical protein